MTDSMPDPAQVAWEIGSEAVRRMNDAIRDGVVPNRFIRDVMHALGDCRRARYARRPPSVPCSVCASPIVARQVLGGMAADPVSCLHYEYPTDRKGRCPDCAWMSYETAEERARDLGGAA